MTTRRLRAAIGSGLRTGGGVASLVLVVTGLGAVYSATPAPAPAAAAAPAPAPHSNAGRRGGVARGASVDSRVLRRNFRKGLVPLWREPLTSRVKTLPGKAITVPARPTGRVP